MGGGYSRAVRAGPLVLVAGTTATGLDGELVGEGNPYLQARQALENVEQALAEAGAGLADVIQTRLYVTDIECWEQVGRAHGEVFGEIRPVTAWSRSRPSSTRGCWSRSRRPRGPERARERAPDAPGDPKRCVEEL